MFEMDKWRNRNLLGNAMYYTYLVMLLDMLLEKASTPMVVQISLWNSVTDKNFEVLIVSLLAFEYLTG